MTRKIVLIGLLIVLSIGIITLTEYDKKDAASIMAKSTEAIVVSKNVAIVVEQSTEKNQSVENTLKPVIKTKSSDDVSFLVVFLIIIIVLCSLGLFKSKHLSEASSKKKKDEIHDCIAGFTNDIKKGEKKIREWNKQVPPFDEDDIHNLKKELKQLKKNVSFYEEEIAKTKDASVQATTKSAIKRLEKIIIAKEIELKEKMAKFQKFAFSGIKIAKLEAEIEKKTDTIDALRVVRKYWIALFFCIGIVCALLGLLTLIFWKSWWVMLIFFVAHIVIDLVLLFMGYTEVPQQEEWVIEWFGKYLCTWESGLHFSFPFFMSLKEVVYMGDWSVTLYLDDSERDGKQSAKIDFIDDSASMTVELFFRLFSAKLAVYEIDDVVSSVKEKMEAGLRAYFGGLRIDNAIETRADMDLRQIITQPACDATVFKRWGAEVISTAVTDIILSDVTEKQRQSILIAKKQLEASEINKKFEVNQATIQETKGKGSGMRIKQLALVGGIKPSEAVAFSIQEQRYEAAQKAKTLIMTDSNSPAADAALAGTAAAAGVASSTTQTGTAATTGPASP